ncbi:50S ribosomal protein L13 [bacterium]|nr:50S ribosomal protein L13 [bacterium]
MIKGTKTTFPKGAVPTRPWFLIDAKDQVLGRLATKIAGLLMGVDLTERSPHVDGGGFVVVLGSEGVVLSGSKETDKVYYHHTMRPGRLKKENPASLRARRPEEIVRRAVKGMLPTSSNRKERMARLKIYKGQEHPHQAQQPQEVTL